MYLRTVLRSISTCLAMAYTDRPCRCKSRIIIVALSLITNSLPPAAGESIGDDAPPVFLGTPEDRRHHNLGKIQTALLGSSAVSVQSSNP